MKTRMTTLVSALNALKQAEDVLTKHAVEEEARLLLARERGRISVLCTVARIALEVDMDCGEMADVVEDRPALQVVV